ncbi:MAG: SAM-dependent methyltransferase [Candidatus Anstonellales archaeon]
MIYLVGLGLYFELPDRIIREIREFERYVDIYTSYVPESIIDRYEAMPADREFLENGIFKVMDRNIAILIPGDPLFATTHSAIYFEAIRRGIRVRVFHNSSIINAISRTGLSPYRFGRVVSVASWVNMEIRSYLDNIEQNRRNGLHTLVLPDPMFRDTDEFFSKVDLGEEIFTLARVGYEDEIIAYGRVYSTKPFAFIVPSELNHYEREFVDILKKHSFLK